MYKKPKQYYTTLLEQLECNEERLCKEMREKDQELAVCRNVKKIKR